MKFSPSTKRYFRFFSPLIVVIPYAMYVLDNRFVEHYFKREQMQIQSEDKRYTDSLIENSKASKSV